MSKIKRIKYFEFKSVDDKYQNKQNLFHAATCYLNLSVRL